MKKLFPFFAIFVLVMAILGYVPDSKLGLYVSKALILEWAVILFIALLFLKNWWLKSFLVWCLIVTIGNYNKYSYVMLNTIFLMLIFYQLLVDNLRKENVVYLLNAICVLGLIQVGWMVLQYCGVWWLFTPKNEITAPFSNLNRCVGFLGNINHAGAFLALALPAFFRRKWVWLIPLIFLGIVLSRSTGGMIAACMGMGVFLWFKKRSFLVPVILIGGLVIYKCDLLSLITGSGRYYAWKCMLINYIPLHWFKGWGLGQFKVSFPKIYQLFLSGDPLGTPRWVWAHNEFIQLWAETGIVGLGLILGYLGHQIVKFLKSKKTLIGLIAFSGVIVMIVNSNANFLFHTTVGIVGLLWLAILDKEVQNAYSKT